MDNSKPAAERIRPILQAMERSIDAARQRRLHESGEPEVSEPVRPDPQTEAPAGDTERAARLKARPKRATPLSGYDQDESLRSRAS